ncbi:MAG: hypothetical protein IT426_08355 [Pirellulales bacterium]|nr:hypothetical protein [Pirellulales bacterium]
MMARFYGYIDKVFGFRRLAALLTDSRSAPAIPTAAIFGTAFAVFARPRVPSGDSVGRVYAPMHRAIPG